MGRRTWLERLGEWAEPAASGGRQGGVCGEDLGGERGRASLGWWAGHAGAWGRGENPTRELLESPVAASHFTGEGSGREPIKSECAAAAVAAELLRTTRVSCAREVARGGGSPRPSHPPLSLCLSLSLLSSRWSQILALSSPFVPFSHSSVSAVLYLGRPKVPWVRVGTREPREKND